MVIIGDDEKRLTSDLFLMEKVPKDDTKCIVSRAVHIKDGIVIDKPDDVDILGEISPSGFILRGLKMKK